MNLLFSGTFTHLKISGVLNCEAKGFYVEGLKPFADRQNFSIVEFEIFVTNFIIIPYKNCRNINLNIIIL